MSNRRIQERYLFIEDEPNQCKIHLENGKILNLNKRVLSLYRKILREHRIKLTPEQRFLGDRYVKEEFKLNKKANEKQAQEFVYQW